MKLIPDHPSPAVNKNTPPAEHLDLEQFVPYRLSVLSNTISGAIAREYAERFLLTIPEWRVMAVLGRFAPLTSGGVAARTAMDKVRVSRAVARLERAGHISRRHDPADRRRGLLRLSARGMRIYRQIVPLALARERDLLAVLSADERRCLDEMLTKLERQAETLRGDGWGDG